jgi:hypothetical protein
MREVGFEEELLYKVNGGGEPGEDNSLHDNKDRLPYSALEHHPN